MNDATPTTQLPDRSPVPSNATVNVTMIATLLGGAIDWVFTHFAIPVPAGSGGALAGIIAGLVGYFSHGGRKGEPV